MKKFVFGLALVALTSLAIAAPISIADSYTTSQSVILNSGPANNVVTTTVGGRTLTTIFGAGLGQVLAEVTAGTEPGGQRLTFEQGTETSGLLRVSYLIPIADADLASVSPSISFGLDLERVDVSTPGNYGTLQFFIETAAGVYSYGSSFSIPDDPFTFTDIVSTAGATNAVSLGFLVTGVQERDYGFDNFSASVPEPGTYALMGLGLAGLALLRRRK